MARGLSTFCATTSPGGVSWQCNRMESSGKLSLGAMACRRRRVLVAPRGSAAVLLFFCMGVGAVSDVATVDSSSKTSGCAVVAVPPLVRFDRVLAGATLCLRDLVSGTMSISVDASATFLFVVGVLSTVVMICCPSKFTLASAIFCCFCC